MWTCPRCGRSFVNTNQSHSCGDKALDDFLKDKTEHTIRLFWYFIERYREIGKIEIHPTKSMIGIAAKTRMAYVTRLGKNFVDIVFPFDEPHEENLCFHRIAQVPGTDQFNHHFRMQLPEDLNEEVTGYMKQAYDGHS